MTARDREFAFKIFRPMPSTEILSLRAGTFDGLVPRTLSLVVARNPEFRCGRVACVERPAGIGVERPDALLTDVIALDLLQAGDALPSVEPWRILPNSGAW